MLTPVSRSKRFERLHRTFEGVGLWAASSTVLRIVFGESRRHSQILADNCPVCALSWERWVVLMMKPVTDNFEPNEA